MGEIADGILARHPFAFSSVSLKIYRLTIFQVFGLIPGGMTSTPGFATAPTVSDPPLPAVIYTTVYPVVMISMMSWAKILTIIPA